jgi:DNA-binding MarR family transcriptional regulator
MEFSEKGGMFTGSVDELLKHCSKLDVTEMDIELEKQHVMSYIMKELDCDEVEASEIYDEMSLQEVKQNVDELVEKGLVEIVGQNEDGEPLFGLTELGKALQQELKKDKDKQ